MAWACLAAVAFAALSIVWSSLRTGIAPMPSSRRACRAMVAAAVDAPSGQVVDLGAGWGTLAIAFARAFPEREVVGYEVSLLPWLVACAAARCLRLRNLRFRRQDHRQADLVDAGVLLCYLFRGGMAELSQRLRRGPRRERLVISNTFALPAHAPVRTLRLADFHRTRIHCYRIEP